MLGVDREAVAIQLVSALIMMMRSTSKMKISPHCRQDLESHLPVMFALAPATSAVASGSDGSAARLAMRVGVSVGGGGPDELGASVGASVGALVLWPWPAVHLVRSRLMRPVCAVTH
jgi:hypothetical protein